MIDRSGGGSEPKDPKLDGVDLRENALRVLGEMKTHARPATPTLIDTMHIDPRGSGRVAARALSRIGGAEAILALNAVWFSGWDSRLCEACTSGLEYLHLDAHATLLHEVDRGGRVERARAILGLEKSGYPQVELVRLIERFLEPVVGDGLDRAVVTTCGLLREASAAARLGPLLEQIRDDEESPPTLVYDAQVSLEQLRRPRECSPLPFGTLGRTVAEPPGSTLFQWLALVAGPIQHEAAATRIRYEAAGSAFARDFWLETVSQHGEHLSQVRLAVARDFLEGPDGDYADDILRSFLEAALSRPDQVRLAPLVDSMQPATDPSSQASHPGYAPESVLAVYRGEGRSCSVSFDRRTTLANELGDGRNWLTVQIEDG
jgi:hypothetical protein